MENTDTLYNLYKMRLINDLKELKTRKKLNRYELESKLIEKYILSSKTENDEIKTWEKFSKYSDEYETILRYLENCYDITVSPFSEQNQLEIYVYETICKHILESTEFLRNNSIYDFSLNKTTKEIIINQILNNTQNKFSY